MNESLTYSLLQKKSDQTQENENASFLSVNQKQHVFQNLESIFWLTFDCNFKSIGPVFSFQDNQLEIFNYWITFVYALILGTSDPVPCYSAKLCDISKRLLWPAA